LASRGGVSVAVRLGVNAVMAQNSPPEVASSASTQEVNSREAEGQQGTPGGAFELRGGRSSPPKDAS
jgi:hypothetical protein